MCAQCCQCEFAPGQTVVAMNVKEGLQCLQCKKMIAWLPEHDPDAATAGPDQRSLAEIAVDLVEMGGTAGLFGSAVFMCDHCDEMLFWKGPDDVLQRMVEDLRECDLMPCPSCKQLNEITDEVKEMLR